MLDGKSGRKKRTPSPRSTTTIRVSQIQRLQDEIDKLAILVHEAKRQSDRIQVAADAFGDLMLFDAETARASDGDGQDGKYQARLNHRPQ
jgi:uncharacterized membrane protein YjjP (DUF1212 family)